MKFLALLTLLSLPLAAQNAVPTPTYPQYFVAFGGGYTRNAVPSTEGTISAAIGLGGGNYSITTVDLFAKYSSVRTGFGKMIAQSGNLALLARVDAGISTGTPFIGNFSGGAIVMYNLGGFKPKFSGTYIYGEVRLTGDSSTTVNSPAQVTPGLFFGVGRAF